MGISREEALEKVKALKENHWSEGERWTLVRRVAATINAIDTGEDKLDGAIENAIAGARMETLAAKARINKYAEGCNAWYTAQAMFEAWSGFWSALLDIKGEKLGVPTVLPVDETEKSREEETKWLFTPRDLCSLMTRMEALEKRVSYREGEAGNIKVFWAQKIAKTEEQVKELESNEGEQQAWNRDVAGRLTKLEGKKKKADKKRTKRPRK